MFRDFVEFLSILVDFLLSKRFFERVGGGGTSFLAERVEGPLNSDLRPTMVSTYDTVSRTNSHSIWCTLAPKRQK
jgi:hypothetical protein